MLTDTAIGRAVRICTLASVVAAGAAAPSFAQTGATSAAAPKVIRVSAQTRAARNFSWFSNGQSATQARIAKASLTRVPTGRRLGNGSWICSPAGFGQKSHCIAR